MRVFRVPNIFMAKKFIPLLFKFILCAIFILHMSCHVLHSSGIGTPKREICGTFLLHTFSKVKDVCTTARGILFMCPDAINLSRIWGSLCGTVFSRRIPVFVVMGSFKRSQLLIVSINIIYSGCLIRWSFPGSSS